MLLLAGLAGARVVVVVAVAVVVVIAVVVMVVVVIVVVVSRWVGLADALTAAALLLGRGDDAERRAILLVPGAQTLAAEHYVLIVNQNRFHPVAATAVAVRLLGRGRGLAGAGLAAVAAHGVAVVVVVRMRLGRGSDHNKGGRVPGVGLM